MLKVRRLGCGHEGLGGIRVGRSNIFSWSYSMYKSMKFTLHTLNANVDVLNPSELKITTNQNYHWLLTSPLTRIWEPLLRGYPRDIKSLKLGQCGQALRYRTSFSIKIQTPYISQIGKKTGVIVPCKLCFPKFTMTILPPLHTKITTDQIAHRISPTSLVV